jgi:CAAX protease family protein
MPCGRMIPKIAEILMLLLLVVGIPILSWRTTSSDALRTVPRTALYFSAAVSQWLVAALGLVAVRLARIGFSDIGLRAISLRDFAAWTLALTAISLALMGLLVVLERFDWWPKESELLNLLIPVTPREKLWAVLALTPTAALCEEFLYRGFLLCQISHWLNSPAAGGVLSSVAFGLAHGYQGFYGMCRAALLGLLLAWPVVHSGSLYPSIAAHLMIDAVGFGWLGPKFLNKTVQTS